MNKPVLPRRVKVFDHRLFRNDKATPLKVTMRRATIVKRYSLTRNCQTFVDRYRYHYDDLVDVVFDHRPNEISRGHFAYAVKPLSNPRKARP